MHIDVATSYERSEETVLQHLSSNLRAPAGRPANIAANLQSYVGGFSEAARTVVEKFNFNTQIEKLDNRNLLYKVVARFAEILTDVESDPDDLTRLRLIAGLRRVVECE